METESQIGAAGSHQSHSCEHNYPSLLPANGSRLVYPCAGGNLAISKIHFLILSLVRDSTKCLGQISSKDYKNGLYLGECKKQAQQLSWRLERDKEIFLVIFVYLFVFLSWSVVVYTLSDVGMRSTDHLTLISCLKKATQVKLRSAHHSLVNQTQVRQDISIKWDHKFHINLRV